MQWVQRLFLERRLYLGKTYTSTVETTVTDLAGNTLTQTEILVVLCSPRGMGICTDHRQNCWNRYRPQTRLRWYRKRCRRMGTMVG